MAAVAGGSIQITTNSIPLQWIFKKRKKKNCAKLQSLIQLYNNSAVRLLSSELYKKQPINCVAKNKEVRQFSPADNQQFCSKSPQSRDWKSAVLL